MVQYLRLTKISLEIEQILIISSIIQENRKDNFEIYSP